MEQRFLIFLPFGVAIFSPTPTVEVHIPSLVRAMRDARRKSHGTLKIPFGPVTRTGRNPWTDRYYRPQISQS